MYVRDMLKTKPLKKQQPKKNKQTNKQNKTKNKQTTTTPKTPINNGNQQKKPPN
jgi:hypothetical protein